MDKQERSEFEIDKSINPEDLDVEAGMQAELFFKWAERSIEAREEMDRAKFALEVRAAQLSASIRSNPKKYGITKLTEGSVDCAVRTHSDYEEAYENYLETRARSALMDKAVEAMEQRKRMIEILVTLHGQSYFAGPSVPRNLGQAWKEVQAKREQRMKDGMTKRRRRGSQEKEDE